ncbi:hypothetical protein [Streptomyces orinoci]|uniref:Uncharacterized protein n=1 Tax=Streptomyces orinoci TaxID=67339 RepID=A0ABV3K794_STRON|nr:hypothetical protein [Streptomyces orinoci]
MNGVKLTLRALHHGERALERRLLAVAQRHRTEHEIHHVSRDLARWSREHAARLAEQGRHYGLDLSGPAGHLPADALAVLRERAAVAMGRRREAGLLLLHDLRSLYLSAAGNSVHWEMLAQTAQATKDTGLLALVSSCHPQTLRQVRWANTMIKNLAPQLLSGL